MKKIKIILNAVVLVAIAHIADAQQLDSTYTYSYNCQGCGTFTTVTTAPVDVETSVSITNETLTDTSQSTLASFVLSAARKKKTVNVTSANRFNVYPTPAKDKYFLNFETEKEEKVNVTITDLFGKKVGEESLFLSKGMNVQERKTKGLTTGHYIVKAETSKGCFVKRLFVDK